MKYKLAIFDMDGTILDTLEDLKNSTNYVLKKYDFKERSLDEIRCFVGSGLRELIKRAVKREEKQINPNVAELCRRFLADNADFSEENRKLSGIDVKSRFNNDELEVCVDKITAYIKEN